VPARPVPDGEYADLPGAGSWRVHIDDDRRPLEDDGLGVLADGAGLGENPLDADRVGDSSALGGYPEVAGRELPRLDEPADDPDVGGLSAADDGVLHTESRELASLGV